MGLTRQTCRAETWWAKVEFELNWPLPPRSVLWLPNGPKRDNTAGIKLSNSTVKSHKIECYIWEAVVVAFSHSLGYHITSRGCYGKSDRGLLHIYNKNCLCYASAKYSPRLVKIFGEITWLTVWINSRSNTFGSRGSWSSPYCRDISICIRISLTDSSSVISRGRNRTRP